MTSDMARPQITMMVAALMPELGIGLKGKLPWRLKTEIVNFKKITSLAAPGRQNAVIMGRKTWESIPPRFRPLPDRLNIVVSRSKQPETNGVIYVNDLDLIEATLVKLRAENAVDKVFLIGGSELYNHFFTSALVNKIILTEITTDKAVEIDTWLNWKLDNGQWNARSHAELVREIGMDVPETVAENGFDYKYSLYERK